MNVVATVKNFNGTADKNGKMPVILNVIGGKAPNRNVLSGTIAENEGLEVGKTYLLQVREVEASETYGRQFVWSKVAEMSALEVLQAESIVGSPEIFSVESKAEVSDLAKAKAEAEKEIA